MNQTKLIYRASKYKCSAEKFHDIVDDRGPTIHIIKTEFGKVFGAYASKKW